MAGLEDAFESFLDWAFSLLPDPGPSARPATPASIAGIPSPPEKLITLVGRTSVGKSSTANSLIGVSAFPTGIEHGTTTSFLREQYRSGYVIQDTPGLLDSASTPIDILRAAIRGGIVLYVTTGQLYREEIAFIKMLHFYQAHWTDSYFKYMPRHLLLFVNMNDTKVRSMPSATRQRELELLVAQVSEWVPRERIAVGSAAPDDRSPPDVDALANLLAAHGTGIG